MKSREFEKEKLQLDLKNADEKLGDLVQGKIMFKIDDTSI